MNTEINTLIGQADAPTQLPGQRFQAPTQMFRLSQQPSAPVDDPVTMVFDPATLDGVRTDPQASPFIAPAAPATPIGPTPRKSDHLALAQRAAVIGGAAVAAALLIYFGRGLVAQPVENSAPVELAAPVETSETDDLAAPIELAPALEVATSAAPLVAAVGSLPPLIDEHAGQASTAAGTASPTGGEATTAAGQQAATSGTNGSAGGVAMQVPVAPIAAQQIERYTDGKNYGAQGAQAAGQALSQLPQSATAGIQQGKSLFGHR
jgi:hypothetical protein